MLRAALVDGEERGTVELLNLLVRYCRPALSQVLIRNQELSRVDKEERAGLQLGVLNQKIYSLRTVGDCQNCFNL